MNEAQNSSVKRHGLRKKGMLVTLVIMNIKIHDPPPKKILRAVIDSKSYSVLVPANIVRSKVQKFSTYCLVQVDMKFDNSSATDVVFRTNK